MCKICEKAFSRKSNLKRHVSSAHDTVTPISVKDLETICCSHCDDFFSDEDALEKRKLRTHFASFDPSKVAMKEEPTADNLPIKKEPCESDCGTCESCLEIHEVVMSITVEPEK